MSNKSFKPYKKIGVMFVVMIMVLLPTNIMHQGKNVVKGDPPTGIWLYELGELPYLEICDVLIESMEIDSEEINSSYLKDTYESAYENASLDYITESYYKEYGVDLCNCSEDELANETLDRLMDSVDFIDAHSSSLTSSCVFYMHNFTEQVEVTTSAIIGVQTAGSMGVYGAFCLYLRLSALALMLLAIFLLDAGNPDHSDAADMSNYFNAVADMLGCPPLVNLVNNVYTETSASSPYLYGCPCGQ